MFHLNKMTVTDIKVYALTAGALATSMTDIDVVLKIIVTLVAIGYTLHKWYIMHGKNK